MMKMFVQSSVAEREVKESLQMCLKGKDQNSMPVGSSSAEIMIQN